jgi:hypothetical protein
MRTLICFFVTVVLLLQGCTPSGKESKIKYANLSPIDELNDIWEISNPGEITWIVKTKDHVDHIEMSGLNVSGIIHYGVDKNGGLFLSRKVVWPMLRLIPNDTHASLIHEYPADITPEIILNGDKIRAEAPQTIRFNGILSIVSLAEKGLEIRREIFPSVSEPAIVERITITNNSEDEMSVNVNKLSYRIETFEEKGVYGSYMIEASSEGMKKKKLGPGEEISVTVVYSARKKGEKIVVEGITEKGRREAFIRSLSNSLVLNTPDIIINEMFRLAKIRATESIYATKGGLMHGPGGGRYYAAIWANDQAEYVNPFFPFVGSNNGNEAAINSFRHFARFMNPEFKPLPSSIIAEGVDIWNGAGDRGDAAMIAFGASRFTLAYGKKSTAEELLPLIKWCLEYCERQTLPEGVIASDSDELEGRFPSGKANLSTNMLTYGAYKSAARLLRSLRSEYDRADEYDKRAETLRRNSDRYFGGTIMGYDTYRYFKGNKKLRSWICLPLTMGVFDRKEETLRALFSPYLWNRDGIYTEAGSSTFWDRSTLYAFRGILYAGETDLAMKYFKYYSQKRLLGEHVPYAVEAWPEGGQRHLSAESGLYCRVIIEGLFGIEPTGFRSFTCTPRLPSDWDFMELTNIRAFENDFDLVVERDGEKTRVLLKSGNQVLDEKLWDGKERLEFNLPS